IYAATILTEVPATFLIVAACIATTFAFREEKFERELRWWAVAGLLTGIDVLFRPEVGLVTAALAVLVLLKIGRRRWRRLPRTIVAAAALSIAFLLVLAPWTI